MSIIMPTSFGDEAIIRKSWVDGNVASPQQAEVVVLLENHLRIKDFPTSPSQFLQKYFRTVDTLLVEEPVDSPVNQICRNVKAKYGLELEAHQVKGWDDPTRWQLWPSYVKAFEDLDQARKDVSQEAMRTFLKILDRDVISQKTREEAKAELTKSPSAVEENNSELAILISRVKFQTLNYFRQSTFPKSQQSLITAISSNWNEAGTLWVVVGKGHGDPSDTDFPHEVAKLFNLIRQKRYAVIKACE